MYKSAVCELYQSSHNYSMSGSATGVYLISKYHSAVQVQAVTAHYECCSINSTVPMVALRGDAEELVSQLISGNQPVGCEWPSLLPKWNNSSVFLEVIEELRLL